MLINYKIQGLEPVYRRDQFIEDSVTISKAITGVKQQEYLACLITTKDAIACFLPAATPNFVVSSTKLTAFTGLSYVALEVDWQRKLAYVGSRETGICFDIVDFSDQLAPKVIKRISTTSTPASLGNECLGVKLFDSGTKLAVTSQLPDVLQIWDLGADPKQLQLTSLASGTATFNIRRFSSLDTSAANLVSFVVTGQTGFARYTYDRNLGTMSTDIGALSGAQFNDSLGIGNYLLAAGYGTKAPISVFNMDTRTVVSTVDMAVSDPDENIGFWSQARSAESGLIFIGGWVSGFFTFDATTAQLTPVLRFNNPGVYRDCRFVVMDGQEYLFAVSSSGANNLDIFKVFGNQIPKVEPVLAYSIPLDLANGGEPYGIQIDAVARKAVIVVNNGSFSVVDLNILTPAASSYPGY
jgi:hypothetical protein